MTQHFDNSSSYDSSSYDSSSYDSSSHDNSQTDFSQSQTSHDLHTDLNTDLSHHAQAHEMSGVGGLETSAFDTTHSLHSLVSNESDASHSNADGSGFEITGNNFSSEHLSAIADQTSQHLARMNAPSDFSPYTTISDSGRVYRHYGSESYEYKHVGYVKNRHFYNKSHYHIGYVGRDGKVYDDHDHLLGWQCAGKIYDKNGHVIPCSPHTSKGAIGAGAYLCFVQFGGV
jgi:hypothetical protein